MIDFNKVYSESELSAVPYGGFELWTEKKIEPVTETRKEENRFGLEDSVHMMKYILGKISILNMNFY